MSIDDLLEQLAERGVTLYLDGERLRYWGPQGALTGALRDAIARDRQRILHRLRSAPSVVHAADASAHCTVCDQRNWTENSPQDGRIRTTCRVCGRFIGYRPAGSGQTGGGT
jgi:TubC N-terminal docking domain